MKKSQYPAWEKLGYEPRADQAISVPERRKGADFPVQAHGKGQDAPAIQQARLGFIK